jgi:hypothetical protein
VTFEEENILATANSNPKAFVSALPSLGTAIDECQLAELFSALKVCRWGGELVRGYMRRIDGSRLTQATRTVISGQVRTPASRLLTAPQ